MIALHMFVLLFFTCLIVYSLFTNVFTLKTIEGLECGGISEDPVILSKTNSNDIEELKKKMEELKDMKSRVENIGMQTKQNTDGIKKLSDEVANAGSDALGGYKPDSESPKLPTTSGLN
jgi:hypothetical protein